MIDLKAIINGVAGGMLLLSLSGCLKKEEPVQLQSFKYASASSCTLNIENMQNIFKENVRKDIDCLEKNLENYIKLVRKKDPRYIEYAELKRFMRHFYKETQKVSDGFFDSAFGMISFFLGEPSHRLSIDKVESTFQLLRILNQNVPSLIQDFQTDNKTYSENRDAIKGRLESFVQKFQGELKTVESNGNVKINIDYLLERAGTPVGLPQEDVSFFSTMAGTFKRMFAGGKVEEITLREFVTLIEKLPEVVLLLKDFDYFNEAQASFSSGRSNLTFYKFFSIFPGLLHQDLHTDDILVTKEQLSELVGHLYPGFNYEEVKHHVTFLKAKMFGGTREDWSYGDILHFFRWGQLIFGSMHFNRMTYQYYSSQNESKILLGQDAPAEPNYAEFFADFDVRKHWGNFKSIITNYRYFKNNYMGKVFQNYSQGGNPGRVKSFVFLDIDQNEGPSEKFDVVDELLIQNKSLGILSEDEIQEQHNSDFEKTFIKILNEISVVKLMVSRLISMYSMDGLVGKIELKIFLQEFAPLLKFFTGDELKTSDASVNNIFNLIDLMQFQSNGNGIAEVEEITEFVASFFFARRLVTELNLDLIQSCDTKQIPGVDGYYFETDCYRKRFVNNFFQDRNYRFYFNELLSDPVLMSSKEHYWNYFLNLERASKKSEMRNKPTAMNKAGLVRLMLLFFNVEGMCARLDGDRNGVIDSAEVGKAYKVFRSFIYERATSSLPSSVTLILDEEELLRSIFLHIVEYHAIPDGYDLMEYHFFIRNENEVTSSRQDISKMVEVLLQ